MYLAALDLGPASLAIVIKPGRLAGHQIGRLQLHPVFRQGVLDRLILADRAVEDDAGFGVFNGPRQSVLTKTDRLGANQDPFGVKTVQNVFEALALFADSVLQGHRQTIEKHLVAVDGGAPHFGISRTSQYLRSRSV